MIYSVISAQQRKVVFNIKIHVDDQQNNNEAVQINGDKDHPFKKVQQSQKCWAIKKKVNIYTTDMVLASHLNRK